MPYNLYSQYIRKTNPIILSTIEKIIHDNSFGYENSDILSAIYSSNIEGNSIYINTYFNWGKASKKTKEKQEIEDLATSYLFAKTNPVTIPNILKAHKILSKSFLEPFQQGEFKTQSNGVFSDRGIVYVACLPEETVNAVKGLFDEIEGELGNDKSVEKIFFLASVLHLKLAHIHPFADGNGRVCCLVEKWFLAAHLGEVAFYIPTEVFYKTYRSQYYQNINLGSSYLDLDYSKSLPFLLMLPESLKSEEK
jgi:Fic family protein